jgi:hypothetical protein
LAALRGLREIQKIHSFACQSDKRMKKLFNSFKGKDKRERVQPVAGEKGLTPSGSSMDANGKSTPKVKMETQLKDGVLQISSGSNPSGSGTTSPSSASGTNINFFDGKSIPKVKMETQLFSGSFGEVWRGTCKVWTARANEKEQRSRSKETLQGQWEIPCSSNEAVFCRDY